MPLIAGINSLDAARRRSALRPWEEGVGLLPGITVSLGGDQRHLRPQTVASCIMVSG